jgi:hypothetical protein
MIRKWSETTAMINKVLDEVGYNDNEQSGDEVEAKEEEGIKGGVEDEDERSVVEGVQGGFKDEDESSDGDMLI